MKTTRRGLFGMLAGAVGAAVLGKGAPVYAGKMTTAPRVLYYANGKVYSTNRHGTDWQEHPQYRPEWGVEIKALS